MTALHNHGPEHLPQPCLGAPEDFTEPRMHPTAAKRLIDRYCAGCPVAFQCLAAGLAENQVGLWGGQLLSGRRAYTWDAYQRTFFASELRQTRRLGVFA